jgi:hypothetical protein
MDRIGGIEDARYDEQMKKTEQESEAQPEGAFTGIESVCSNLCVHSGGL